MTKTFFLKIRMGNEAMQTAEDLAESLIDILNEKTPAGDTYLEARCREILFEKHGLEEIKTCSRERLRQLIKIALDDPIVDGCFDQEQSEAEDYVICYWYCPKCGNEESLEPDYQGIINCDCGTRYRVKDVIFMVE